MTYRKAGAISFAVSQSTRSRAGQAAHHRAMKRYEQPIKMAPRHNAGLIGKAQAPHIQRRGYPTLSRLRSGLRPKGKVRLERVCSFSSTATSGGITARPNEAQLHVTKLRERVSTALGARSFYLWR